jgi:HK97 gp10 family phage protein
MTFFERETQKEVAAAIAKLQKLSKEFTPEIVKKEILEDAAVIMQNAAAEKAPRGGSVHRRYSTAKASKSIRAPRGSGRVVAIYYPGNLRGSIKILNFKRSKDVFVGAALNKRGSKGTFGQGRFDGYYAHMVEFGTRNYAARPFMRPAVAQASGQVQKRIIDLVADKINDFNARNRV